MVMYGVFFILNFYMWIKRKNIFFPFYSSNSIPNLAANLASITVTTTAIMVTIS